MGVSNIPQSYLLGLRQKIKTRFWVFRDYRMDAFAAVRIEVGPKIFGRVQRVVEH